MLPLNPPRLSQDDLPGVTAARVWVVRNRDCMDDPRTVAFDVGLLIREGLLREDAGCAAERLAAFRSRVA